MKATVIAVLLIAAVIAGLTILLGGPKKSAADKCDEKYGYVERCVQVAEYGSVDAAHEAEHDEQIEEEVGEVEEVIKHRQAEKIAGELEGIR